MTSSADLPRSAATSSGRLSVAQPRDRRVRDVDRVRRAERLGHDVADAGHLEDGPRRAAGDHAGARRGGLQQHAARAGDADDGVDDRGARERDVEERLARLLDALLHREPGLLGLAVAEPDAAVAVADHHERGEREAPAALDDLRHAVDLDGPVLELLLGHQNATPRSRIASASAATRPW